MAFCTAGTLPSSRLRIPILRRSPAARGRTKPGKSRSASAAAHPLACRQRARTFVCRSVRIAGGLVRFRLAKPGRHHPGEWRGPSRRDSPARHRGAGVSVVGSLGLYSLLNAAAMAIFAVAFAIATVVALVALYAGAPTPSRHCCVTRSRASSSRRPLRPLGLPRVIRCKPQRWHSLRPFRRSCCSEGRRQRLSRSRAD